MAKFRTMSCTPAASNTGSSAAFITIGYASAALFPCPAVSDIPPTTITNFSSPSTSARRSRATILPSCCASSYHLTSARKESADAPS